MVLVGVEMVLTNLPKGLAAGEEPGTSNSFPVPFLKHEMSEALANFSDLRVIPKPRAMRACA